MVKIGINNVGQKGGETLFEEGDVQPSADGSLPNSNHLMLEPLWANLLGPKILDCMVWLYRDHSPVFTIKLQKKIHCYCDVTLLCTNVNRTEFPQCPRLHQRQDWSECIYSTELNQNVTLGTRLHGCRSVVTSSCSACAGDSFRPRISFALCESRLRNRLKNLYFCSIKRSSSITFICQKRIESNRRCIYSLKNIQRGTGIMDEVFISSLRMIQT